MVGRDGTEAGEVSLVPMTSTRSPNLTSALMLVGAADVSGAAARLRKCGGTKTLADWTVMVAG